LKFIQLCAESIDRPFLLFVKFNRKPKFQEVPILITFELHNPQKAVQQAVVLSANYGLIPEFENKLKFEN
jgi:hypothetical protein